MDPGQPNASLALNLIIDSRGGRDGGRGEKITHTHTQNENVSLERVKGWQSRLLVQLSLLPAASCMRTASQIAARRFEKLGFFFFRGKKVQKVATCSLIDLVGASARSNMQHQWWRELFYMNTFTPEFSLGIFLASVSVKVGPN